MGPSRVEVHINVKLVQKSTFKLTWHCFCYIKTRLSQASSRSCIVKNFFGKFSKSLTEENSSLVSFLAKLENGRSYPRDCFWTIDFNKQAPKTVLI